MSPHLAEAIQLIYCTTPIDAPNAARKLVSQFTALSSTILPAGHLDNVMLDGGDFVVDVMHKVGRKTAGLESRVSALESELSGMRKDLNSSREEVRGWESWNDTLHLKKRRFPRRYNFVFSEEAEEVGRVLDGYYQVLSLLHYNKCLSVMELTSFTKVRCANHIHPLEGQSI